MSNFSSYQKGSVSRGLFGVSEDFHGRFQSLDERFVKRPISTFFFEAQGDAMAPTICQGDVLVVDRSLTSYHQRVCIVVYEGEMLCKRVRLRGQEVFLCSDNSTYKTLSVLNSDELAFWGVVIARAADIC